MITLQTENFLSVENPEGLYIIQTVTKKLKIIQKNVTNIF